MGFMGEGRSMDVSIVIVNFNTARLTQNAIKAVQDGTAACTYEVIVVDNSNGEEGRFPAEGQAGVRVLSGVENRGFGHACNLGAAAAVGEYLLFLNSDTRLHAGALDAAVGYLRAHPGTGALGIHTLLPDGTLDHGCKRGFPTPQSALYYFLGMDRRHPESRKYGAYRQTFLDEHETSEVDAVSGAFLLMPRRLFEALGGFDEQFFMYGEDLDLCYRVKQAGRPVVYFAGASMTHFKGQSGLSGKSPTIIYHFYHAMTLFYKKHYRKRYCFLVNWIVYAGIWLKYHLELRHAKKTGEAI
jgi:GT2 family glycosyltransferase